MNVILVRCGRTADEEGRVRGPAAQQRPLSPLGRRAVRETAAGLVSVLGTASLVGSSPLMAAVETAAIVAKAFDIQFRELDQLDPAGRPAELQAWIGKNPAESSLILVGHEPSLSRFACRLIAGKGNFLSIKPAGACLVEVQESPKGTVATLQWVMTPRQLRRHAR
jgi:phosphohistidine phosphatase SixA